MSLWMVFRTLCVALFAVMLGISLTIAQADSDTTGSNSNSASFQFAAGLSTGICQMAKLARRLLAPAEPSPSQQLNQYAYDMTLHSRAIKSEVVEKMELVGMNEFKAVHRMVVPKHTVREKTHVGLAAKGVPNKVAEAVALELDGARKSQSQWDDFKVDESGNAHIFRVIVRLLCEDDECDVAMAATGASFNAAQEISHYEKQEIPEYGEQARTVSEYEDGIFRRYEKKRVVNERVQIGTRVNHIPVMKQKTFTPDTMEDVKNYLEGKAMKEVLLLAPANQQRQVA